MIPYDEKDEIKKIDSSLKIADDNYVDGDDVDLNVLEIL